MTNFRLLNYVGQTGDVLPGLSVGDRMIDLGAAVTLFEKKGGAAGFSAATTLTVLESWDAALPVLHAIAAELEAGHPAAQPLSDVTLKAPLLYPSAIFNAAANYYAHRAETGISAETIDKTETQPYIFLKSPPHTVIGPGDAIVKPRLTEKLDWEAELGVVIGRYGRNVKKSEARDMVAGYTIVNDVSARDLGRRPDWQNFRSDWFGQKTFETSAPMGPWIVPASAIPDPYELEIKLWVNDEQMQHGKASQMIFNIEELVEYISARLTLRPGDVISTGTPAGVGAATGTFLNPGDTLRIEISGIGEMTNPIVADDDASR